LCNKLRKDGDITSLPTEEFTHYFRALKSLDGDFERMKKHIISLHDMGVKVPGVTVRISTRRDWEDDVYPEMLAKWLKVDVDTVSRRTMFSVTDIEKALPGRDVSHLVVKKPVRQVVEDKR
jgi:hypothetical protein